MLLVFDDELDILRDMQPLDRDVFNYLAARVDFVTGLIGNPMRVSYGGMALDLSERDQARRVKGDLLKLTPTQARNSVKRLITAGLLCSLSKKGAHCELVLRRVFWVKALEQSSSVKNPDDRLLTFGLTLAANVFGLINNSLDDKNQSSYHNKINPDDITLNNLLLLGGDDRFAMFLEWQPSEDELSMIFHRAGVDRKKIKKEWETEFVSYWWADQKRCCTQQKWTQMYGKQMVGFLRNPERADALCGVGGSKPKLAGPEHYPDYARIPRDDAQLVPWMRLYGYGDPLPGHDYRQARAYLQRAVDKRLSDERGRLS